MSFAAWVQERLNIHGAKLTVDGAWGAASRAALKRFQEIEGLVASGVTDETTIDRLRGTPQPRVLAAPAVEDMPPWLAEMTRRMGLHEQRDNAELTEWLRDGKFLGDPSRLPWCGDAVETCFARTLPDEILPSNPFWAQAWVKFGRALDEPMVGAIAVFRWSQTTGHVGPVVNWTNTTVTVRGGNQSNMIKDSTFSRKDVMSWRWPKTYPIKVYPRISAGAAAGGGEAETR